MMMSNVKMYNPNIPLESNIMNSIIATLQQTATLSSAIALDKEGFALGKAFAERCTRQRAVGISLHGKGFFAECRMSGTLPGRDSTKKSRVTAGSRYRLLCQVSRAGTRQRKTFFLF
jgi:hypothetical protein